jgi:hypothetical protein
LVGAFALLATWSRFHPGGAGTPAAPTGPPVRVGVLHSRTGTMAISERPVIDAALLALEEVNAEGGVLGRPVEAVLADGQSDEAVFARQAEKLPNFLPDRGDGSEAVVLRATGTEGPATPVQLPASCTTACQGMRGIKTR